MIDDILFVLLMLAQALTSLLAMVLFVGKVFGVF